MQRRFIAYSRLNINIFKIIGYIIFLIIGFLITIKILFKLNNTENNSHNMLAISTNNIINNIDLLDIVTNKLSSPESILGMTFSNGGIIDKTTKEEKETTNVVEKVSKNNEPIIYIYNTHQTEEYDSGSLKDYNITPTVYMAANILQKRLNSLDINSIVEDENIVDVLKKNNWKYSESYYASKMWLENAKKNYPSLKYFIDVHRDSNSSSVTVNDIPYARMMFVVGMNHDNYEKNEALVIKLNNYLSENYDGLMRDIFYGKRSKYNQDFDENTILIEIGGPKNTIDEVQNSVYALADALSNVIGDV